MAELYGVNGDGAIYADTGDGLVWIPTVADFNADGYNWSDIQWVDVLPYAAQDPYQASDNPAGSPAPPPPAPPSESPEPAPGNLPLLVGLAAPDGVYCDPGSPIFYLQGGEYDQIPDAATFAALGFNLSQVTWLPSLPAPQGADLPSLAPLPSTPPAVSSGGDVPLDPTVYGFRQPSDNNAGIRIPPTYEGKQTSQGAWSDLISALGNEAANGIATAQVIANTMGNAVA